MWTKKIPSLALVLVICAGTVGLSSQKDAIKTQRFHRLDINRDGKLSLTELRHPSTKISAKRMKTLASDFQNNDKNNDGFLTLAEFKKMKRIS
jgi:Ca2+-binding EF-hand superfamily protein